MGLAKMALPKNAKRCSAIVAKYEGISPTQALDLLADYAFQAWLDARVCRAVPKPASEPAV
jgi:hypothetical protein